MVVGWQNLTLIFFIQGRYLTKFQVGKGMESFFIRYNNLIKFSNFYVLLFQKFFDYFYNFDLKKIDRIE